MEFDNNSLFGKLSKDQAPLALKDWDASSKKKYPFRGVSRRPHEYFLSTLRNLEPLKKIYPAPLAMLHPEDASANDYLDNSEKEKGYKQKCFFFPNVAPTKYIKIECLDCLPSNA